MKFPLILRKSHLKKLARSAAKTDQLVAKVGRLKKESESLRRKLEKEKQARDVAPPASLSISASQIEFPVISESPLEANPLACLSNHEIAGLAYESFSDLLSIVQLRHYIAKKRWASFMESGASLRIHDSSGSSVFEHTTEHNIKGITNSLSSIYSLERSEFVFRPVMANDRVYSYQLRSVFPEISVLLVGPRTEYEVLLAMSYGINPSNLKAVDLISYSPWITTGDMHALPFEDNSFDVVILGWVLGYSRTPDLVAKEIIRVARPNAVVSIGNDCYTRESLLKSNFFSETRPQTVQQLLNCFGRHVGAVFYAHEPHYTRKDIPGFTGHLIATFEIKK